MKKLFFYLFLLSSILLITCQKEVSYETGGSAEGSLVDDGSGDCLPKTVNGIYIAGTALSADTNTIQISVDVTKTGKFTILSDTINGYYFKGTGTFSIIGSNSVTLKGYGTPAASGTNNFLLQFDSTACNVAVTVLPAGTGPAAYSILSSGSPASCSGATPVGNYIIGTALNSSNTVTLNVDVTTVGTYNVSTTAVSGMTFSASGAFSTTGAQTLVLTGSGTPTGTAGAVTISVTAGSSTCSFQVNVTSGAVGTLGGAGGTCTPANIMGTYTQGVALTSGNTVQVQIDVTTAGPYNISTNTVSGFSFAGSGNATTGMQLVTLSGTGTPSASGPVDFTVTFGTSMCSFTINVVAGANTDLFPLTANSWWSYDDIDGIFVTGDSLTRVNVGSKSFSGVAYRIFQHQDNTTPFDSFYYRRSGNNYYEYNYNDYYTAVFLFDVAVQDSILFLKEGLAVNDTWESKTWSGTFSSAPASLKYTFTCTAANTTATINGNNFNGVYKIAWRPKINIGAGFQDEFLAFESWYAIGVGMIYFKVIDLTGGSPSDINIQNWHVF